MHEAQNVWGEKSSFLDSMSSILATDEVVCTMLDLWAFLIEFDHSLELLHESGGESIRN